MDKFKDFEDFTEEKKEEFYKAIGKNVARIRKKHKLSQLKLSQLMGHKSFKTTAKSYITIATEKKVESIKNYNLQNTELFRLL